MGSEHRPDQTDGAYGYPMTDDQAQPARPLHAAYATECGFCGVVYDGRRSCPDCEPAPPTEREEREWAQKPISALIKEIRERTEGWSYYQLTQEIARFYQAYLHEKAYREQYQSRLRTHSPSGDIDEWELEDKVLAHTELCCTPGCHSDSRCNSCRDDARAIIQAVRTHSPSVTQDEYDERRAILAATEGPLEDAVMDAISWLDDGVSASEVIERLGAALQEYRSLRRHSEEPVVEGYVPSHWRETLNEYPSAIIGFVADLSDHDAEAEKWVRVELRPIGQPIDSGEGER